jgi:trk system potassium uptake protein
MALVHVVVVGCGRVGSELAVAVEAAGHTVSIIDKDRNAFRHLPDSFSGKAVLGFGFDRDHLEEAGIEEADALAAVTNGDNSNVLAARIARETYEIPHVVARIYDPRRAVIYQRLGIQTVATVAWTTDQVLRRLFPDQSVSEWTDASGTISLVERALPQGWAGRKLADLDERDKFRLVALSRAGKARLVSPDVLGQEGDLLHLAVNLEAVEELEARLTGSTSGART